MIVVLPTPAAITRMVLAGQMAAAGVMPFCRDGEKPFPVGSAHLKVWPLYHRKSYDRLGGPAKSSIDGGAPVSRLLSPSEHSYCVRHALRARL